MSSEAKRTKAGRWSLGTGTSSRSDEIESWNYIRQKDYQLHVLHKTDKRNELRPPFPTNEGQRLAFLRGYATTPFKIQILFLQQVDYATFFWLYIGNVLFRSLPTNYIHMFLAAYNSDEHLFASKMVPLSYGANWQVVLCGLLQLVASADILALFIHYSSTALYLRDPWNKCAKTWNNVTPISKPYRCYTLQEFHNITQHYKYFGNDLSNRFVNEYNTFVFPNKTMFTVSPLSYFIRSWVLVNVMKYFSKEFVINFSLIWISAALFYKQLYKKYVWKLLRVSQLVRNTIYLCATVYILSVFLEEPLRYDSRKFRETTTIDLAKGWDLDFYADTISGPPVAHLLASRSTDEVNPARDSILVTLSNSAMYFFIGLVYYKLKDYIESSVQSNVVMSSLNPYPIFYMWPFFFHNIVLGALSSRVFYSMNLIVEFIIFMITYQLLIDVIVCEWQWAKRWVATIFVSVIGLILSMTLDYTTKMLLYVFTTAITSLTEALAICWLYPLNRFLDDIHFHNGTPVHTWRKWSLRLLPWYYVYKIYTSFKALMVETHKVLQTRQKYNVNGNFSATNWAWVIGALPLPLGALFAIFRYVVVQKKGLRKLINPRADWGPRDHATRQLRKEFDSREYVCSQSSRFLSRHLIAKGQTGSYRLDVRYQDPRGSKRRSTLFAEGFRYQADRKHI